MPKVAAAWGTRLRGSAPGRGGCAPGAAGLRGFCSRGDGRSPVPGGRLACACLYADNSGLPAGGAAEQRSKLGARGAGLGGARRPSPLCGEPRRRRRKCAVIDSGHLNTPSQKRAAGGCGAPCRRGAAPSGAPARSGVGSGRRALPGSGVRARLLSGCRHRASRLLCRNERGALPVFRLLTCSGCFFCAWVSLDSMHGVGKYI